MSDPETIFILVHKYTLDSYTSVLFEMVRDKRASGFYDRHGNNGVFNDDKKPNVNFCFE